MTESQLLELVFSQIWQVTVLCVVAGWLSKTWLASRPVIAYQLWIVVLAKCLTPPLWASHCGVFSWCFQQASRVTQGAFERISGTSGSASMVLSILGGIWAVGFVASLARTVVRWRRVQSRIRQGAVLPSREVEVVFSRLREKLKIRRKVELLLTREAIGPAVIGIQRPLLIVPQAIATDRPAEDLEPILAHELLHIRRGDTIVAQIETLVRALWWFHPAVQRAADATSQAGELSCDGDVLGEFQYKPRRYADSLVDVLEARCRLQPVVGGAGIRSDQVTRDRLRRIMTSKEVAPGNLLRVGFLILAGLVLLPGKPVTESSEDTTTTVITPDKEFGLRAVADSFEE